MKKIPVNSLHHFLERWYCGKYLNQRMGQAFCNTFPNAMPGDNKALFYERSSSKCLALILSKLVNTKTEILVIQEVVKES